MKVPSRIHLKKPLAIAALILIAACILLLLYGTVTHHTGILLFSLFYLIVIPVLVYLFLALVKIGRDQQ